MPILIPLPDATKINRILRKVTLDHHDLIDTIAKRCADRLLEPIGVYNVIYADIRLYLLTADLDEIAEDSLLMLGRELAFELVGIEAGKRELVEHFKKLDNR